MGPYGSYIQFENSKFLKKLYQVEGKRNTRIKQVKLVNCTYKDSSVIIGKKTYLIRKSTAMGISIDVYTDRILPYPFYQYLQFFGKKKQWKFQVLKPLNSIINATF